MPKKVVKRPSSHRKVSVRPLSFWHFIRKNLLIISGLLLLPVTVGAVISSYNYANLGSATGRRGLTLRTQDTDVICDMHTGTNKYEMVANNDCRSCIYKCNRNDTFLGYDTDHTVSIGNSECLAVISRVNGCGVPGTPIPLPSPTPIAALGSPKVSYEAQNCGYCVKRLDYPPYDQWCAREEYTACSDYIISDISKNDDPACANLISTIKNCGSYDPTAQRPTAEVQQPTSPPEPTSPSDETTTADGRAGCQVLDTDQGPYCWCAKGGGWQHQGAGLKRGDPVDSGFRRGCETATLSGGGTFDFKKALQNFFGFLGF